MSDSSHPAWNPALEEVIKREGETAESLFWLHNKATLWAQRRNDCLQIPTIVLSSVTGFFSATTDMVPQMALGGVSLLVGILTTINSYYRFSSRQEAHKIAAQLYMKAYKTIEVELSLPVSQRSDAGALLKELRDQLARISETAPPVPEVVIAAYKREFREGTTAKPIIANGLDPIVVFRESVQHVEPRSPERPVVRVMV